MLRKYPTVSVSIRNGLIAGVLGMIFLITLYALGRHPFLIPVYVDFRIVLFATLLFFTGKELRDFFQGGAFYFAQGMLMSLIFTTVYSMVMFFGILLLTAVKPAFVADYISLNMDQIKNFPDVIIKQIGQAEYDRGIATLQSARGIDLAVLYAGQSLLISFFVSIIISVILRRQPKHE
jgi:Protein of unknown function (DUF4199)